MKTKAAVAWKAGAPLTIEEMDLKGPRAGEVVDVGPGAGTLNKGESIRSVVLYQGR